MLWKPGLEFSSKRGAPGYEWHDVGQCPNLSLQWESGARGPGKKQVPHRRFAPVRNDIVKPGHYSTRDSERNAGNRGSTSLLWAPLLAITGAAFAVEVPFFFFGAPAGHDLEFHLYSWLEVLAQWKHGILYPRWAALANFGWGEPRFLFYPPASWTLGTLLSAVFPWPWASELYVWLALTGAGAAMFVLARRWLDRKDAIFAAMLYAANPYHLVIVYWRSAFGEMLASCLVPLLLLFVLQAAQEGEKWRALVPLALVLAAAWLTNAPAALMIHYSFVLLMGLLAWKRRSPQLLLIGAGAVALGACLAAFYLIPVICEQKWVTIGEAVSAGERPQDSFLFAHTPDADHDRFNRIVSWIALLEMAVILIAGWAARRRRMAGHAWGVLITWAMVASGMMFPVSAVLWRILPKLAFMQFPWRWLLCLSMMFAIFVTAGFRKWWQRGVVCAVYLAIIVAAWHRVQAPWWETAADLREMQQNMVRGTGYEGTDEYTPVAADPSQLDQGVRNVTVEGPARAAIHVLRWDAEEKLFTVEMSQADRLALRLLWYPAWRTEVNGQVVETAAGEDTGQMLVPVGMGVNRVEIKFARTWDRSVGGWISVVSAVLVAGVFLTGRNLSFGFQR